jgi:hypothetical protein
VRKTGSRPECAEADGMGALDVPAPLLAWADASLAEILSSSGRLVLWGALSGVVAMLLYAWISPQERIARAKRELAEARRALDEFDGEFADSAPLLRTMLARAFRPVLLALVPALVSGLPVILVAIWMSTSYGHAYPPPAAEPEIRVTPKTMSARWRGGAPPGVVVFDGAGRPVEELGLEAPVPVLHKRRWWNAVIGNPAGYVPANLPIDAVEVDLPRQQHLGVGPAWLRGWEAIFFVSVAVAAVVVKTIFRIE